MGYPGDVFLDDFQISTSFSAKAATSQHATLHPAEISIMNKIAKIGKFYSLLRNYLEEKSSSFHFFEMTLKASIEKWLEKYKSKIVTLEALCMDQNECEESKAGREFVTVSFIYQEMQQYGVIMEDLCSFINSLEATDSQTVKGCQILNLVHSKMIHSGNPHIKAVYNEFVISLGDMFIRKLAALLLYSDINDPYQELFVKEKSSMQDSIEWDCYEVDEGQIPYFMKQKDVDNTLLIVKATAVLKKFQSDAAQSFVESYSFQLSACSKTVDIEHKDLLRCLEDLRRDIGYLLFDAITVNDQISHQLHAFRSIYLAGQGNFLDDFLDEQTKLKAKLDESFVPININGNPDLNIIFNRLYTSMADTEVWAQSTNKLFQLEDSDRETNQLSVQVFGTNAFLNYEIKWPLNLIVSRDQIENYNSLLLFFTILKKAHKRLISVNNSAQNGRKNVPKSAWILCNRLLFFLNSLWSYIQMDLIDSQYGSLIEMSRHKEERVVSLEQLQEQHANTLKKLISGCFLEDKASSKRISGSIHEILICVNQTCSLIERSMDLCEAQNVTDHHYDSISKDVDTQFQFLFQVFQGIQDSSRSLLGQFLIGMIFKYTHNFDKLKDMADADALWAEANKKATQKTFFGGNKLDEAADLYGRAANAFKLKKQFKQSGDAFMEQGKTYEKLGERDESSGCYINASKSYKKEFPKEAVDALKLAVTILTEKGRFSTAANNQKQIAEIYEQDIGDFKEAMDAYELAAEWYSGEDSNAQANGCLLKVAQFAGTLEEYDRAVDLFERVAAKSLENNLTKWSVREYLFKAMICVLCLKDTVRSNSSLDKYMAMDSSFSGTRECALCKALVSAVDEGDPEAFTAALQDFDRMTKLDEWKTSLLLRVKKSIEDEEEDYT